MIVLNIYIYMLHSLNYVHWFLCNYECIYIYYEYWIWRYTLLQQNMDWTWRLGHVEYCYFTNIKPRMLISKKWLFSMIPMKNWGVYPLCREHRGPKISPACHEHIQQKCLECISNTSPRSCSRFLKGGAPQVMWTLVYNPMATSSIYLP